MIRDKEATMNAYWNLLLSDFEKLKKKRDSGQNLTNDEMDWLIQIAREMKRIGGR